MKLLYISALSSKRLITDIYNSTGINPGFAVQKFSRLLVNGLSKNGEPVTAFSSPPVIRSYTKKLYYSRPEEIENGIHYRYVPLVNIPIIKHIVVFLYTFFYILFWERNVGKDRVIICDVLAVSLSMGALLASKVSRIQSIGVVTDIFDMMVGSNTFKAKIAAKLNSFYVHSFDKYILLTEQMNQIVNPHKKPYIVMEGLCDESLLSEQGPSMPKSSPKVVLYAGGIYEKYGLKMLAEAFIKANVKNAVLVYYGSGPYVKSYNELCKFHPNLQYRGVASNEEVLIEERKATLLVNPRFSTEEFTQYSFPSKNMEYMASGTPLLTTKLPGMPIEYWPYVFVFNEETVEGYSQAITSALKNSHEFLVQMGDTAKSFVLSNKNDKVQGKRIIDFIKS